MESKEQILSLKGREIVMGKGKQGSQWKMFLCSDQRQGTGEYRNGTKLPSTALRVAVCFFLYKNQVVFLVLYFDSI
jgi:hypothetical protein